MRQPNPTLYRTLWISDVHLGSRGCQARRLDEFLRRTDSEQLYLVGDIFDGWKLSTRFYWPPEHSHVLRTIIAKTRQRTRVCYLSGNHDEFMRQFVTSLLPLGRISLASEAIHITADGRRLLVLHGDAYDSLINRLPRLARTGDLLYSGLLAADAGLNRMRASFGRPARHFAGPLKTLVKNAVQLCSGADVRLQGRCERGGLQGVVCGHTHHAEIRDLGQGITYYNCGDWVDSCTALAEDHQGRIRLLRMETAEAPAAALATAAA